MRRVLAVRALLLLPLLMLAACNQPDTPTMAAPPQTKIEEPPEPPEVAKLAEIMKAFYEDVASSVPARRKEAVAGLVCRKADIPKMFPNHDNYWGILEIGLMGLEDDNPKVSEAIARHGAVRSVKLVNLRGNSALAGRLGKDVLVYKAILKCANATDSIGPLIHVNDRWVWYPNLEKLTETMPAK